MSDKCAHLDTVLVYYYSGRYWAEYTWANISISPESLIDSIMSDKVKAYIRMQGDKRVKLCAVCFEVL